MEAKELIRRYSAGERDFAGADLRGADLRWANLSGANVTDEQLAQAKSLKGATMPTEENALRCRSTRARARPRRPVLQKASWQSRAGRASLR
ncbi:pentapeptide repeat-containing protein [Chloroflexota bacterium]